MSRSMSLAPREDPRGRRRAVSGRLAAALEARYLALHAQLIADNRPMSGRAGGHVYYWAYGRLCWRRHVVPKDPRTPAQQSSRAAFGASSRAWSENQALTREHRDAWRADAAKLKTRPRLAQSGPLTVQQHYVGRNAVKGRWGLPLLLEPAKGGRETVECTTQDAESASQVRQRKGVAQPSLGTRRAGAAPAPSPPRADSAAITPHASRITHRPCPGQPDRVQRRPPAHFPPRKYLYPSALRNPPRTAPIPPPHPFRCNAGGRRSPSAPSPAVGPSDSRPLPIPAPTPAFVNSGAAASPPRL